MSDVHPDNSFQSDDFSDIFQLDGNESLNSSVYTQTTDSSFQHSSIPVIVSIRPPLEHLEKRNCFNRNIRKDDNLIEALNLPTFTVYNMRSLWSKVNNLAEDIIERSVDISFLSEVWEKKENPKHQSCIEEMLEIKGISYISTPRPGPDVEVALL